MPTHTLPVILVKLAPQHLKWVAFPRYDPFLHLTHLHADRSLLGRERNALDYCNHGSEHGAVIGRKSREGESWIQGWPLLRVFSHELCHRIATNNLNHGQRTLRPLYVISSTYTHTRTYHMLITSYKYDTRNSLDNVLHRLLALLFGLRTGPYSFQHISTHLTYEHCTRDTPTKTVTFSQSSFPHQTHFPQRDHENPNVCNIIERCVHSHNTVVREIFACKIFHLLIFRIV